MFGNRQKRDEMIPVRAEAARNIRNAAGSNRTRVILLILTVIAVLTTGCSDGEADRANETHNLLDNEITDNNSSFTGTVTPQTPYVPVIKSTVDFNKNRVDDYTDFVQGARKDVKNSPIYDGSSYIVGGYPPDNIGVCTDVIWRAFKHAGYSLKDMVDKDIRENISQYPRVNGSPDPNIDFRRVPNLFVFFKKYGQNLTIDKKKVKKWNAGDIVVFRDPDHIAIISDKRNILGEPYIIHNAGLAEEADALDFSEIIGHFRFEADKIPKDKLIKFDERT